MVLLLLALAMVQDPGSGTYSMVACREPCNATDSAAVVARGIIVLAADHRGCFDLTRHRHHPSYLALFEEGYTGWSHPTGTDSVRFTTYRSPDAGHRVSALLTDTGFVGTGHSWGAGVAYIDVPDEFIVGRRIGPPDMNRCGIYRADRRSRWMSPLIMTVAALGMGLAIMGSHYVAQVPNTRVKLSAPSFMEAIRL